MESTIIVIVGIISMGLKLKIILKASILCLSIFASIPKLKTWKVIAARTRGITQVLNIFFILLYKSVPVKVATKRADVDMGEDLSPKNAPDKTAPPVTKGLKPMAFDIDIEITPAVEDVPKLVPVKSEIEALKIKTPA